MSWRDELDEQLSDEDRRRLMLTQVRGMADGTIPVLPDREEWPVHQPEAFDAPIPGRHWYSGCDPDRPRVNPETGRCEDCGEPACRECGRANCPDH